MWDKTKKDSLSYFSSRKPDLPASGDRGLILLTLLSSLPEHTQRAYAHAHAHTHIHTPFIFKAVPIAGSPDPAKTGTLGL